MRLDHPRLLVDDLGACVRFYRDLLAWDLLAGAADGPVATFGVDGAALVSLEDRAAVRERVRWRPKQVRAGMTLVLDIEEDPPSRIGDDRVVVTFAVDDVRALLERVTARGANVVARPHERPDLQRVYAHVRDPAGTLLEFHSPL